MTANATSYHFVCSRSEVAIIEKEAVQNTKDSK